MRFGTDGIRGRANAALTPELCLKVGRAVARVVGGSTVAVGRDPRHSGQLIEAALAAGICAEGVDVALLGVVPTPAVAAFAAAEGVAGVMISASHNPAEDNGIKVFGPGGTKLSDEAQDQIERAISDEPWSEPDARVPTGAAVGVLRPVPSVLEDDQRRLRAAIEGRRLSGLSVVLDCANGAASEVAPAVFAELGAATMVLNASPDGMNINDGCGSTHPEGLCDAVRESGADVGFAFDGDADRVLAVDRTGRLIDGDQLLAIAARDLKERGRLRNNGVAVTVMTNLGFRKAMAAEGIVVVETPVGDRHVLEAIDREGLSLGGEQSGHLIFRDLATTGDGVLGAVVIADILTRTATPLDTLADSAMTRLPQVLRNVTLAERDPSLLERVRDEIDAATRQLGDSGRVLVRQSGTEPMVRVMVEATDAQVAVSVAEQLVDAVAAAHR